MVEEKNNNLDIFVKRMRKLDIEITFISNYPWIYLDTINGKKVTEKLASEHGFVVGLFTLKGGFRFSDTTKLFEQIKNEL